MDKENVVYTHNGVPVSLTVEENLAICHNMAEFGGLHIMQNKPGTERQTSNNLTQT